MADCARMNAWHRHPEKFPGLAQKLANKAWATKNAKRVKRERMGIAALLNNSETHRQDACATNLLSTLITK